MVKLDRFAKAEEVNAKVKEILEVAGQYGWLDKRVMPYGYGVSIKDLMNYEDYAKYSRTSQQIIKAEINGLIDILNIWLEQEKEEKVVMRMPKGSNVLFKRVPISLVDDYIALGAVLVKDGE